MNGTTTGPLEAHGTTRIGADVRGAVDAASLAELPDIVGVLAAALAAAQLRLATAAVPRTLAEPADVVDAGRLSELFEVPASTLRDLARRKRIPALWIGRSLRFDVAAVRATLAEGSAPRRKPRSTPVKRKVHRFAKSGHPKTVSNDAGFSAPATAVLPREEANG